MRVLTIGLLFSSLICAASACQDDAKDRDDPPASLSPTSRLIPQIPPPLDLKAPPADATKAASGLALEKLTETKGALAQRGDTVMVHYTGWRQRTGETFFTTKGGAEPIALDIAHAAAGFSEALQKLRKGEKAVLWVPSSAGTSETLVYEIEVVDVISPAKIARQASHEKNRPGEAGTLVPADAPTQAR